MSTNKRKKVTKKTLYTLALLSALIIAGGYGSTKVLADENNNYPPIVQKLASKFGLNEADVNEVFVQERSEMWEKRKQSLSDQLEQAVNDGKITEDQKNKILEKKDELEADRQAQRQEFRDDMQKWMEDNGINTQDLMPYMGFGRFGGAGFHHAPPAN